RPPHDTEIGDDGLGDAGPLNFDGHQRAPRPQTRLVSLRAESGRDRMVVKRLKGVFERPTQVFFYNPPHDLEWKAVGPLSGLQQYLAELLGKRGAVIGEKARDADPDSSHVSGESRDHFGHALRIAFPS